MTRKFAATLFFLFPLFGLPNVGGGGIVAEFANLEVAEGGFATLRVKLDAAPGGPVTVAVSEVAGGSPDLYLSTVCTFVFWYDASSAAGREVQVALYDGETPATVANFLNYVAGGDYDGTFIHRLAEDFVFQGGGYGVRTEGQQSYIEQVPPDPPVVNEPKRSNFRGTLAMAKLGGDPDSATSEWFFNLSDNRPNLDFQNGGFTAFGQVIGDGMTVVDEIAALPAADFSASLGSPFGALPLHDWSGTGLTLDNLVWVDTVSVSSGHAVAFDNSNWNQWQTITIHAAPDDDSLDGAKTFRLSGGGFAARDVVVVSRDNAVGLVFEEPIPAIPEGGSAEIRVKLAGQPTAAATVGATRISGDSDLAAGNPGTAGFAPGEWDAFQGIAINAAEDADAADQHAIFRFGGGGVHEKLLVLWEADNDVLGIELEDAEPILAPEGEVTTLRVRLTAQPLAATDVLFARMSGDSDISRATFLRFDTPVGSFDVELFDQQAPATVEHFIDFIQSGEYDGLFFHDVAAPGGEVRAGAYSFSAAANTYSYVSDFPFAGAEAGAAPGRGTLALPNPGVGAAPVNHWFISTGDGPPDALVFGRVLDAGMTVVDQIAGLPTYDLEGELEGTNPGLELGGTLERVPMQGWDGTGIPGTGNLAMTGVRLTSLPRFTPANWNQWQAVTVRARKDDDFAAGEAVFRILPAGGVPRDMVIVEREAQLAVEVDASALNVPEGGGPVALGIRLSDRPDAAITVEVQLAGDGNAGLAIQGEAVVEFTPGDFGWRYVAFTAAEDANTVSGQAVVSLVPSVGADIIPGLPQVTLYEIDDDVEIDIRAGDNGGTVPAGVQFADTNDPAVWPLRLVATAAPGHAFSHWESAVPGLVENQRMPATTVILAESATVTAIFALDDDGDQIPDFWETGKLASLPGATIAEFTPDGDPDRDGKSNLQEYYDGTEPLRYEFTLTEGWNCLGMGAEPQSPIPALDLSATRDGGVDDVPLAWDWDGTAYRPASALVPYRGVWIHAAAGGTLGIPAGLQAPPAVAPLRQGWNLVVVDMSEHTGPISDIFGAATAPAGWAWLKDQGIFALTRDIVSGVPVWLYAPQAIDQPLGVAPGGR